VDVDRSAERIIGIAQAKVALSTLEQALVDPAEVLARRLEGLQEEPGGGLVELADGGAQVFARTLEVIALPGKEGQALVLFGMLLDCKNVDGAEALDALHEPGQFLLQLGGVSLHRLRHFDQLLEGSRPLGLHALADEDDLPDELPLL